MKEELCRWVFAHKRGRTEMKKHKLTVRQRKVLIPLSHGDPFFLWAEDSWAFVDYQRSGASIDRINVHGNTVRALQKLDFIIFTGLRSCGMDQYTITPKGREALDEQR